MRAKTPTFIAEFQLCATPADERALRIRLDAGRNIYNAALGEALRRLNLMRESKAYQAARAMPKGKDRAAAYRDLRRRFGFSFYDLKPFTAACRNNCWIQDHLGSQEAQALTAEGRGREVRVARVEHWAIAPMRVARAEVPVISTVA